MPYKQSYTPAELFLFRQRDKRIMFQSIFSSLCSLGQCLPATQTTGDTILWIKEKTKEIVKEIEETYPTEEARKTPEYKQDELAKKIEEAEAHLAVLNKLKEGSPGF